MATSVFVVTTGEYDDFRTDSIWDTYEKAQERADEIHARQPQCYGSTYPLSIETWELNQVGVRPNYRSGDNVYEYAEPDPASVR